MADPSQWRAAVFTDNAFISKRTIRKTFISKRHYVPAESINISTLNRVGSPFPLSSEENNSPTSCDRELIYMSPEMPAEWGLSSRFAAMGAEEERRPYCGDVGLFWPGNPMMIKAEPADQSGGTEAEHSDEQEEKNCSITLEVKHEKDWEDSAGQEVLEDLQEITTDVDDVQRTEEDSPYPQFKPVAKPRTKVSTVFSTMKRRGVEGDTENRPYKCTYCNWAFKKSSNLLSHIETHSGLKPHVCNLCGKAYSHQGTLQQHKRLHTGERPYHCPFCDKTYIWSSDYRKHIRTHTGEKPYVCESCGKDFVRSSDLRKHERNMHVNDKPFPCTKCGQTFNKPLSLLRHERTHLGEQPFICPECGKAFAIASRMAEHRKIHAGIRPYVCPVCSKTFTKSSNLMEHQTIHSGLRPYKCSECGVAFAMASRLVRHQRVHTGERPYSCGGCGMSFSRSAALKRHQEQQCDKSIFVCVDCDKAFSCDAELSEHMKSHASTVPASAPVHLLNTQINLTPAQL